MPFRSQTANHANLNAMHNKRTNVAAGYCYERADRSPLNGRESSINYNFMLQDVFEATTFVDYSFLRKAIHACNSGRGRRIAAVDAWFKKIKM